MKFIITLCLLISLKVSANAVQLQGGVFQSDSINSAAKYSVSYEIYQRSGLAFEYGASFMQTSDGSQDLIQTTLPFIVLKHYYKLPRLPFLLTFGAGFGLNHIPEAFGTNYLGTFYNIGLVYQLSRQHYVFSKYQLEYGKTLNNGNSFSFDGNTFSIGVGMYLIKPKNKQLKKENYEAPNSVEPGRRQRPRKDRRAGQSTYKKAQNIMNDLSWPTY